MSSVRCAMGPNALPGASSAVITMCDGLAAVERLAEQPHLGRPGRVAGTREFVVPRTPYVIPYRLQGDRLEIVAVFHGRQKWPKRL